MQRHTIENRLAVQMPHGIYIIVISYPSPLPLLPFLHVLDSTRHCLEEYTLQRDVEAIAQCQQSAPGSQTGSASPVQLADSVTGTHLKAMTALYSYWQRLCGLNFPSTPAAVGCDAMWMGRSMLSFASQRPLHLAWRSCTSGQGKWTWAFQIPGAPAGRQFSSG